VSREKAHSPFFLTEPTVTSDSFLNILENWLLTQLNTIYEDYILQLDGVLPIFTGMCGCFSVVFFNRAGSNVLQKENHLALGHPVRRI